MAPFSIVIRNHTANATRVAHFSQRAKSIHIITIRTKPRQTITRKSVRLSPLLSAHIHDAPRKAVKDYGLSRGTRQRNPTRNPFLPLIGNQCLSYRELSSPFLDSLAASGVLLQTRGPTSGQRLLPI